MSEATYKPRAGSKTATAIGALLDGPMSCVQLAGVMDCRAAAVTTMLNMAEQNGALVKLRDETGLLHYALAGMPVDERFKPAVKGEGRKGGRALAAEPVPGRAATDAKPPVIKPFDPADPFGLVAKAATAAALEKAAKDVPSTWSTPPVAEAPAPRQQAQEPVAPALTEEDSDEFAAGLFSNGELVIRSGDEQITLPKAHTKKLFAYLDRIDTGDQA